MGGIARIASQDATGTAGSGSSSVSATWPAAPTVGNLLIAIGYCQNITTNVTAPTGYTQAVRSNGLDAVFDRTVFTWYKIAASGESNPSMSQSLNTSTMSIAIFEYQGFATSAVLDATVTTNSAQASVTTLASGSTPRTMSAFQLVISTAIIGTGSISGFSFTNSTTIANVANGDNMCVGQRIVDTSAAYSDTANWTTARAAGIAIATFRSSQGGHCAAPGDGSRLSERLGAI